MIRTNKQSKTKKAGNPKTKRELANLIAQLPKGKLVQALQRIAETWWSYPDTNKLDFNKETSSEDYEEITNALCSIGASPKMP